MIMAVKTLQPTSEKGRCRYIVSVIVCKQPVSNGKKNISRHLWVKYEYRQLEMNVSQKKSLQKYIELYLFKPTRLNSKLAPVSCLWLPFYQERVHVTSPQQIASFWRQGNPSQPTRLRASSLSTYDFSTLYTTLPHNLIKDKLVDLIKRTFQREGSLYIACNDRNAFFTSDAVRNDNLWSCQKVCEALTFLLDNIYIRFGSKL